MAKKRHPGTELPVEHDYGIGYLISDRFLVKVEHVFGEFIVDEFYETAFTVDGQWHCGKVYIDMARPKYADYWRVSEWWENE